MRPVEQAVELATQLLAASAGRQRPAEIDEFTASCFVYGLINLGWTPPERPSRNVRIRQFR